MLWPGFRLPSLSRGPRTVLGMDIGTDGVRLALVERRRHGAHVLWTRSVSLTELQGFADYDSVHAKLGPVLQDAARGGLSIATVPPWNSARVVVEEMPAMDAERFAKAAVWYFQRNRHDDMSDPFDHAVAQPPRENSEGRSVVDGLMVSMDRVMLDGLLELCSRLRLRLKWLLPSPLVLSSTLDEAVARERPVIFLDIGSGQTRMVVVENGVVRLVRRLKPCANDVVRHVCDEVGIGWTEASAALQASSDIGPLAESDPEGLAARSSEAVATGLETLADQLRGELERSAAYVAARHGAEVDRVFLVGGLAGSRILVERLGADLPLRVSSLDPSRTVSFATPLDESRRPAFALAIGAALTAFESPADANMYAGRPTSSSRGPNRARPRGIAGVAGWATAAGVVLGVGLLDLVTWRQESATERAIEVKSARLQQLAARANELARQEDHFDLEDRIEVLRGIYSSRQLFTPFFSQVVATLPRNSRLDHVEVERVEETAVDEETMEQVLEKRLTVQIQGHTSAVDEIGEFVVGLESARLLQRIEILRIRELGEEESERRGVFAFELHGEPVVARQEELLAAAGASQAEVGR